MGGYWYGCDIAARRYSWEKQYCRSRRCRNAGRAALCRCGWHTRSIHPVARWALSNRREQRMNYERALITGGAGLVGSHIADLLVRENISEIIVLDDFSRGRRENLQSATTCGRVRVIDGDIRNSHLVRQLMD